MEWLNYHHLLYFWTVVREGSVSAAAVKLRLAQPTVSAQLKQLEDAVGERLFTRTGRSLVLTELGRLVFRYADEIFATGRELIDAVNGRPTGTPLRFVVGLCDAVPKHVAHRLLEPALAMTRQVRLVCREDPHERLLAELAVHALDLVISDAPVGLSRVKAYSHLLGESGTSFFAAPSLARTLKGRFPASLQGAPLLLPTESGSMRRALEQWLDEQHLHPVIVGEIEDGALANVFGQFGAGVFTGPTALEREIARQYDVKVIGRAAEVKQRFYAISVERRLTHPAVLAITGAARRELFAPEAGR